MLRAIEVGAHGYFLNDMPHEELFRAVRSVARGVRYLAPEVTDRLVNCWQLSGRYSLADPELDVLRYVARGERNKQIAASLGIAEPTVKAHLVHIFEKLGVENRTAAAVWRASTASSRVTKQRRGLSPLPNGERSPGR